MIHDEPEGIHGKKRMTKNRELNHKDIYLYGSVKANSKLYK